MHSNEDVDLGYFPIGELEFPLDTSQLTRIILMDRKENTPKLIKLKFVYPDRLSLKYCLRDNRPIGWALHHFADANNQSKPERVVRVHFVGPRLSRYYDIPEEDTFLGPMINYCRYSGLIMGHVRFICRGENIRASDTPLRCSIENSEQVKVAEIFYP